jgi:methionyl-tRNA formyltransferase
MVDKISLIMKVVFLTANIFGYRLISSATAAMINFGREDIDIEIVTLDPESKTRMYDGLTKHELRDIEYRYKLHKVKNINEDVHVLRDIKPDIVFMAGWRQILSADILKIPAYGFIGFHPTLLPVGRGPAPLINTILYGFVGSGVTMYHVNTKLDTGDIIDQEPFEVTDTDTAATLYKKMCDKGSDLLYRNFIGVVEGVAPRRKQDEKNAVIFRRPTYESDNAITQDDSVELMYRKIRAFTRPYLGAYIIKDGKRLTIWDASLEEL